MNSSCRIELLGPLRVIQGSRTVTHFGRRQAASLLGYLAYHIDQPQTREALIALLWPDVQRLDIGRDRLSTVLSALRGILEPPGVAPGSIVVREGDSLHLKAERVSTDVQEFQTLITRTKEGGSPAEHVMWLQQAVDLYRGKLMEECYDEWITPAQSQWEENYASALLRLAQALERCGETEQALAVARRVTDVDPFQEEAYRTQMRLLAALHRHAAIAPLYAALESSLRKELGRPPSQTTQDLASCLTSGADQPAFQAGGHLATVKEGMTPLPLPVPLTRLVGREEDSVRLERALVSGKRLITLLGHGGVGKTRLALEVARRAANKLGWPACFVPLADLAAPEAVIPALARALGLSDVTDAPARVVQALNGGPALLILDNAEHLIEAENYVSGGSDRQGANFVEIVHGLLKSLPDLVCLVTSRQALYLQGEQEYPVPPLGVPQGSEPRTQLLACPSVALFLDRARLVAPDFALDDDQTAENVSHLCRVLEGMPLAIEMAAGWAGTLSPLDISRGLERHEDLLVSRYRDVPARHRSLRAAFAWATTCSARTPRRSSCA